MVDKIAGCLFGGALGDALGYPIEFDKVDQIDPKHDFTKISGPLLISDDTQMTLFTANALLLNSDLADNTWACYQDWLETQFKHDQTELSHRPVSWLMEYSEMYASREPGRTCLSALMRGIPGTLNEPVNQSKGCGAVMRVAPLTFASRNEDIYLLAARNSALTHGHPMSILASAALVGILKHILAGQDIAKSITLMRQELKSSFNYNELVAFDELIQEAVWLSTSAEDDLQAISQLGEGWIAEETLAIAIYCALKYQDDLTKALQVAVIHDGDSDSTGAVTGQILGAKLGFEKLPQDQIARLDALRPLTKMVKQMTDDAHTK